MFGITDFGLFLLAGLLLNFTPGVDMLYVIHRAGSQGLKAGFFASLGIAGGCLIHIFFAVIGLSALLAASSAAFSIIKFAGAAYLICLGLMMIFQAPQSCAKIMSGEVLNLAVVFKQGVLINFLNPKIAVFFLAFIPQFIAADSTQKPMAFLLLGIIFNLNSTLVLTIVAWLTVKLKDTYSLAGGRSRYLRNLLGLGFIALGARLALDH